MSIKLANYVIRTAKLAQRVTAAGQLDVVYAAWIYHTDSEDKHDTWSIGLGVGCSSTMLRCGAMY